MPYHSRWSVTIPPCTLPTWIFGSPGATLPDTDPIFIDAERPDTYSFSLHAYREWSQRLAVGLQNAGLKHGDRVLVFSENNIFYPIIFMGIIMAGGIFTGTNPTYLQAELAHQLRDSGAKFMFCNENQLKTGLNAADTVGMAHDHVFVFNAQMAAGGTIGNSCKDLASLLAPVYQASMFKWEEFDTIEDNRTVCLNYSSGTTGVPKGVEITHYNYVANCIQFIYQIELDPDEIRKRSRDRQICFLPLYHAMAQTIFLAVRPKRRVPLWIMRKYTLPGLLQNIERFRINDLLLVPSVLVAMAKSQITRTFDLSSVERVMCGAAPLGREACEVFEQLWPAGKINVKQGWGMTEATCSVLAWHPCELSLSFSVGEPSANCEIKLVDSDEAATEIRDHNVPGEIWVRAPNVMKGYWHNPQATAEVLTTDGWLKTGDIGFVDEQGKVYIVDRKKELIKVRGNQVAPAELEAVLIRHPNIVDAAVVGVTINGEEAPRAYIVPWKPMTADDVKEYMKQHVSRIKYLTGGVIFIDAIPKNPSGKIVRKILRDRAKEEIRSVQPRL